MYKVSKMKWFLICGLLILGQPGQCVWAGDNPPSNLVNNVIERQCSNESSVQSVLIEGSYVSAIYNPKGQAENIWYYGYFSFARSNDLMRVLRLGYEDTAPQKSDHTGRVTENVELFYSPSCSVYIGLSQQIAHKSAAEKPQPYPLDLGYGIYCRGDNGILDTLSPNWERVNKEGLLTVRKDPDNPSLLLAELRRDQVRVRSWIDPAHGNLIVRRKTDQVLTGPENRELVWDEYEIVPKKFGKSWFFERAWHKEYRQNSDAKEFTIPSETYLYNQESFTVTNFVAGADFKLGELEFSTNNFPRLVILEDKIFGKTIDLTTGQVIPTNATTWELHPKKY